MTGLTNRQRQVYDFIVRMVNSGLPPTRQDICDEFGWSSPNAAQQHLQALDSKGWIEISPLIARGIRVKG